MGKKKPSGDSTPASRNKSAGVTSQHAVALVVLCVAVFVYVFRDVYFESVPVAPKSKLSTYKAKKTPTTPSAKPPPPPPYAEPSSFGRKCERRSAKDLSVEEYLRIYDGKRPVLVEDAFEGWGAMNWTKEWFQEEYGEDRVTMAAVSDGDPEHRQQLALPLDMWIEHAEEGTPQTWTYIQDEVFIPFRDNLIKDLPTTKYLEGDLFRLLPKDVQPTNMMLLWGTPYSRSHLHIDPYNWTGTNMVFWGTKRWKLYPPGQDDKMYIKNGLSGFPLECPKYNSPIDAFAEGGTGRWPKFKDAYALECVQKRGEMLIIPTGWFHQAYNEEETIAVSSQMFNDNTAHIVLEEVFKGGGIGIDEMPENFYDLSPKEQVLEVSANLSPEVLRKGKAVTDDALRQINRQEGTN